MEQLRRCCEVRVTGVNTAIHDQDQDDVAVVNVTSRSREKWSLELSPFYLGPCKEPVAAVFENAWQYSKVYAEHADAEQNPTAEYFAWAKEGFERRDAVRYPMGKCARPLYSWVRGQKLDYINARKALYAPLYEELVGATEAFARLRIMAECGRYRRIWLRDYDGYDHVKQGMSLLQVVNNSDMRMGHAFVLAGMLTGDRAWLREPVVPIVGLVVEPQEAVPVEEAKISAGALIRCGDRYLLCHSTGVERKSSWSIPKGMMEAGETPEAAAVREIEEETGLKVEIEGEPYCSFAMGKGDRRKTVVVFLVDLPQLPPREALHCKSLIEDDAASEKVRGLPEMDDFRWVTWEEARNLAFASQRVAIFDAPEPPRRE